MARKWRENAKKKRVKRKKIEVWRRRITSEFVEDELKSRGWGDVMQLTLLLHGLTGVQQ